MLADTVQININSPRLLTELEYNIRFLQTTQIYCNFLKHFMYTCMYKHIRLILDEYFIKTMGKRICGVEIISLLKLDYFLNEYSRNA